MIKKSHILNILNYDSGLITTEMYYEKTGLKENVLTIDTLEPLLKNLFNEYNPDYIYIKYHILNFIK